MDWPATEIEMQIQPIAAIPPLKIRQKPVVDPLILRETENTTDTPSAAKWANGPQSLTEMHGPMPYLGDRPDYQTQVLATALEQQQSAMERTARIAEYAAPRRPSSAGPLIAISV